MVKDVIVERSESRKSETEAGEPTRASVKRLNAGGHASSSPLQTPDIQVSDLLAITVAMKLNAHSRQLPPKSHSTPHLDPCVLLFSNAPRNRTAVASPSHYNPFPCMREQSKISSSKAVKKFQRSWQREDNTAAMDSANFLCSEYA